MGLSEYLITLLATIFIELTVAFALGLKKRDMLLAVLLVNLITHPILAYILVWFNFFHISFAFVLVLEILVIIAEYMLYKYMRITSKKKCLRLAIIANIASYMIGIFIYGFHF